MDRYGKLQVLVYSVTPSHTSTCIIWNSLHNHLCFNLHSNAKRSDNLSSASIGAEQFKNTLTSERVVNFTHKDWEKKIIFLHRLRALGLFKKCYVRYDSLWVYVIVNHLQSFYNVPMSRTNSLDTDYDLFKSLIALACVKHSCDEIGNGGNECGNTIRKKIL